MVNHLKYWNRIFKAYIQGGNSHLSFWHDIPIKNEKMKTDELGQYYMTFHNKADYDGYYDKNGIPMLNYRGHIGLQYNPIAIAQYGLGNYNLWCDTKDDSRYNKFIKSANWLVNNLEQNVHNLWVWMHHFDFEYRDILKAPWYSGLAQGQGISVLLRAYKETNDHTGVWRFDISYDNDKTWNLLLNMKDGGTDVREDDQLSVDSPAYYWADIKLPDAQCENCTFRMTQSMGAIDDGNDYFTCADIKIK